MDKLHQLLSGNLPDFTAVFSTVARESSGVDEIPGYPIWLEGWAAPARAGYVAGDGEFIYEGQAHRFHFCGLPLRHGQRARVSGTGTVSQIRTLSDFSGAFLPWKLSPTAPRRRSGAVLRNENGVVIDLVAVDDDPLLELPYDGLSVRLATRP